MQHALFTFPLNVIGVTDAGRRVPGWRSLWPAPVVILPQDNVLRVLFLMVCLPTARPAE